MGPLIQEESKILLAGSPLIPSSAGLSFGRNMSPFRCPVAFKDFVNAVDYEHFVLFLVFIVNPTQYARAVAPVYNLIYS